MMMLRAIAGVKTVIKISSLFFLALHFAKNLLSIFILNPFSF